MKHAVFQPVGNPLAEDTADHGSIGFGVHGANQVDGGRAVEQQPYHDARPQHTRQKRGRTCTRDLHVQAIDEQGVSADVKDVHHQRGIHAGLAVVHGTQQRRSAVIKRKRRITHRREVQIGAAVCKRILRQRAKAQPEQWIGKDDGQHAQHRCQSGRHIHQLLGRTAGAGVVPPAQVLRGHHGASRSHSRKELGKQHVDAVHQRNCADCTFGYSADHYGVRHADKQRKELLYHQRNNQPAQVPVRKQPFLNSPIRWKHPPAFLACVFCAALRGFPPRSGLRPPVCSDNK